jgi:hypothetical protein
MNEESRRSETGELSVEMPPHARLANVEILPDANEVRVWFSDGGERVIAARQIVGLCGASIRTEMISLDAERHSLGSLIMGATTNPLGPARRFRNPGPPLSSEGASLVFALRTAGPGELLYIMADSFNFRQTLGPDAGYSTEINLRELVRRIAALTPKAIRDDFVTAVIGRVPLPAPLASLVEFFKANAARL